MTPRFRLYRRRFEVLARSLSFELFVRKRNPPRLESFGVLFSCFHDDCAVLKNVAHFSDSRICFTVLLDQVGEILSRPTLSLKNV